MNIWTNLILKTAISPELLNFKILALNILQLLYSCVKVFMFHFVLVKDNGRLGNMRLHGIIIHIFTTLKLHITYGSKPAKCQTKSYWNNNKSFANVAKSNCLRMAVIDQNYIHYKINSRFKFGSYYYHQFQDILTPSVMSKNLELRFCVLFAPHINTYFRALRTGCRGAYLYIRAMKWQGGGENCITRNFHKLYSVSHIVKVIIWAENLAHIGRCGICTKFWSKNVTDHFWR
jgi:hypothetical protein